MAWNVDRKYRKHSELYQTQMKNKKNIPLLNLVAFFAFILSACTTVKVVPRGSLSGNVDGGVGDGLVVDQGQVLNRQQVQASPQNTTPRPLGVLKNTPRVGGGFLKNPPTTGLETYKGSAHVRVDGDAPQELLSQVSIELKSILEKDFEQRKSWMTKDEVEKVIARLFMEKGRPLRIATTTGERGAFALVKYLTKSESPIRVDNPSTTTETLVYSEGEIPTGAKRNPAVRGPEQFQPKGGQQRPQGVGHPRPHNTQPPLPQ